MCQPLLCTPAESLRVATAAKTPEVVDLSGADSDSKSMLVSVTLMFISVNINVNICNMHANMMFKNFPCMFEF